MSQRLLLMLCSFHSVGGSLCTRLRVLLSFHRGCASAALLGAEGMCRYGGIFGKALGPACMAATAGQRHIAVGVH